MSRLHARRFFAAVAVAAVAVGTMTACSSNSDSSSADAPLRIVASAVPHTEILKYVQDKGLLGDTKIDIREITGDLDANEVLEAGDTDANYFQHVPYQDSWSKEKGVDDLVAVAKVHVEPLGAYSKKVTNLADLPQDATVALPNNVTNFARGLFLLQQGGLIKLDQQLGAPGTDITQISEKNIIDNPKGLKFVQVDPPQLPRTLDDGKVDLAVINGNYAIEGGLTPAKDALVLEKAEGNPYANVLTVRKSLQDDPRVQKLAEALTSKDVATYIEQTFQGSVIPVNNA
ncbi:D-methionine transport system substrate-binding protein [Rhodococcus sp. 27YEA15]|uniref:MetQ/NlpA family ABC transporter substrate-binding protein n=1 Tax=Rhodococcus sp. 27YEA15 TaxID=3156259 RepID=UPI003C7BC263